MCVKENENVGVCVEGGGVCMCACVVCVRTRAHTCAHARAHACVRERFILRKGGEVADDT